MATRHPNRSRASNVGTPKAPSSLSDHPFYGLRLIEEQKILRDLIYDDSKKIIFCNAAAGTGKTTVAVATSILMHQYNLVGNIVYIVHSVGDLQGYLPGTISEKSSVLFEPLYQAIITANENPEQVICKDSLAMQKSGLAYITAITDTYLRGSNIGTDSELQTIMIVDEAQNFDEFSLRKTLTRACENTKVIVIGHDGQIDLPNKSRSGFIKCMNHFISKNDSRVGVCELSVNHRGFVSQVADELWDDPQV